MRQFECSAYDVVTLEGIAQEAQVSPGLVHHYFGTKRVLFVAVVARAISRFQEAVRQPRGGGGGELSACERLRAALNRYLDFVLERANGYAFVIGARGAPDDEVRRLIDAAREAVLQAVFEIVGISEPGYQEDLAMWGWLGFVERATTRWVDRDRCDRVRFVELLLSAARPVLSQSDEPPSSVQ
jgi:AcrR family transcriptional regulator